MKTTKWLRMMLAIVLPLLGGVLVLHLFSGFAAFAAIPVSTGTIIIEKQTVPDGAAGSFSFTDTIASPNTFTLSDNGKETFIMASPGLYTVTEDDPMPGFLLTGLTCDDSDSVAHPLIRTAIITLGLGETVTCTFTNTALAEPITVVKELIDPPTGMAVISNTITYTIWITNSWPITIAELPLLDYYCPACMEVTSWSVTPTLSDTILGTLYWADLLSPTLGGPDFLPSGKAISVTVDFHAVISDTMYWKEKWHDYALSGMPDFDQKQDKWGEDSSKWTYCGPVAAANSLWWFDSKFEDPDSPPPPIISDSYPLVTDFGNSWDDHDPRNVISLTNKLAELMKTSTVTGTQVNDLADGIEAYIAQQGLTSDYTVTVVVSPTFQLIEDEVRRSEDVILLLGFWQIRFVPWPEPFRIGGHYVTVAGVDSENFLSALSDPFFDRAEIGLPGYGRVRPNPHLPLHPLPGPITDTLHNNAWFASHDVYLATPSLTPGGTWQLPLYALDCDDVSNFEGQNEGDWENGGGECISESPIFAEIEYMVAVSPITPTIPCAPTNNVAVVSGAKDDWGHDLLPWVQDNVLITITAGTGTIVIEKVTDPAGGAGFAFTDTIEAPNSFNLDHGQTQTFDDVLPGTYTVTETNPAPAFDLIVITCDDGSSESPSTWDVGTRTATVNLDASETVTCTFTNRQRGTIVVEKQTDPDGASGTFDFTDDVGTPLTFSLSDDQTRRFTDVVSGTYAITETVPAPTFDLTAITCSDGNSSGDETTGVASISLQPGETVTCTFSNTQRGHIVVDKVTDPSGDAQSFDFTLSGGPSALDQSFSLTDAALPHDSGAIKPGSGYSVTETVPGGWALVGATCTDGSPVADIALSPGEAVTCTFTNQADTDGDGVFDADDCCPFTPNPGQEDADQDGVGDACDNCPAVYNPDQADSNGNGIGDACEKLLTVIKAGDGGGSGAAALEVAGWSGTVTSDPVGIHCGDDCQESYPDNTVVTLTAHPGVNSYFVGWSDDCSGTDPTAQVTMDTDKTCTATFGYPVGGIVVPVDKLGLLAPWMGMVTLAGLAALGVAVVRRRRSA